MFWKQPLCDLQGYSLTIWVCFPEITQRRGVDHLEWVCDLDNFLM